MLQITSATGASTLVSLVNIYLPLCHWHLTPWLSSFVCLSSSFHLVAFLEHAVLGVDSIFTTLRSLVWHLWMSPIHLHRICRRIKSPFSEKLVSQESHAVSREIPLKSWKSPDKPSAPATVIFLLGCPPPGCRTLGPLVIYGNLSQVYRHSIHTVPNMHTVCYRRGCE